MEIKTVFSNVSSQLDKLKTQLSSIDLGKTGNKSLQNYEKQINNFSKTLGQISNFKITTDNIDKYKSLVKALKEEFAAAKVEAEKLNKAFGSQESVLSSKRSKAIQEIEALTGKSFNSKETGKQAGLTSEKDLTRYKQLKTEITKTTNELLKLAQAKQGVETATKGLDAMAAGAENADKSLEQVNQEFQKIQTQNASNTIKGLVAQFTSFHLIAYTTKQAISSMVNTVKELDESLTSIAAVTGRTRDQMWDMVGTYNDMAYELGTTTKQIAEASKLYFQQGRSQAETIELVEQTAILATVAELDFAQATDYLTAAVNGFNIEAQDSIEITDTWAALAAASAVDVQELAVAISKVASLAKSAGMDINTTSAFLSKMLETTREAPENLGTALKTIIARFNDLKKSEEELEDGGSANRVEAALASAGIALRDQLGNFREFDDVLLELSSVWDTLSINTQRYIATQAAGSRQQSRFIALVSDYKRNLELLEIAENSTGSAAAQFQTQLTGLQASFNRLTAAWEGFYTSLESGPSLISSFIDLLAGLISTFGQIGVGGTAAVVAINSLTFSLVGQAAAQALANKASGESTKETLKETIARVGLTKVVKEQTKAIIAQTVAQLKSKAATLLSLGPYAAIAAAVVGITAAIIALATAEQRHIEKLKEEKQTLENTSNTYVQQAKSLETLRKEYQETFLAGEDLNTVQQKLQDSFPDLASQIDLTSASMSEANEAFDEAIRKQKELAAANASAAISVDREVYNKTNSPTKKMGIDENGAYVVIGYSVDDKTFETLAEARNYIDGQFEANPIQIEAQVSFLSDVLENDSEGVSAALSKYVSENEIYENTGLKDENGQEIKRVSEEKIEEARLVAEQAEKYITDLTKTFAEEIPKGTKEYSEILTEAEQKANDLVSKFYNNDYSLSAREATLLQQIFGTEESWTEYAKGLDAQVLDLQNRFEGFSETFGDSIDYTEKFQKSLYLLGTSGIEILLEMLSAAETSEEWNKIYDNVQKVGEELSKLQDLDIDITFEDLTAALQDSNQAFVLFKNLLEQIDVDDAKETFSALANSIDFSEIDLQEYFLSPLKEYYSSLEKLKSALNNGISLDDFELFRTEYADIIDLSGFYFDEFTGKVYGSKEALVQAGEAIRKKKLEEVQANIVAIQETITLKNQTIEVKKNALEWARRRLAQGDASQVSLMNQLSSEIYLLNEESKALEKQLQGEINYAEILESTTATQNYMNGELEKSSDAIEKQIDLLEKQKEALEEARDSAKNYADMLAEAIKNRLNDELDYYQNAVENYYDALDQALQELIDNAQDSLDALKDKADSLEDLADNDAEALQEQADAVINFYDAQIDAIQAKIDALNNESDALERLQKIQEARDAYEQAKQKTRLVLVEGAGWRFKTDKNALSEAGQELATAEQENQAELLQKQIDQLEEIKSKWEQIAENIGKATSELEEQAKFQEYLNGGSPEDLDNLYNQFVSSVGQNNNLYENALQAQNQYGQQNDSTVEGTLAWQILQWQKAQEQAEKDKEQFGILTDPNAKAVDDLKKQLLNQLGSASSGGINNALNKGLEIIGNSAEKVNAINATLDALEELINKMDMTSEEIAQYNSIQSLVGQAQLEALLQGGSIYNQLESEINGIISLNDQIEDLNIQIEALNESQEEIKGKIEEFKEQTNNQFNNLANAITNAGNQIFNAIGSSGARGQQSVSMYSNGGLVDYTGPAKVHGQRNRPEMVLNNSQSAGLFKFIDSLVTGFTLPMSSIPFGKQNQNIQEESTTFSNCSFEIKTDANNFEQLIQEIKQKAPFKRKS